MCGSELKVIGKEVVRTEVEFIPSKVIVKQIVREVGKCLLCGTDKSEYLKDHFQKATHLRDRKTIIIVWDWYFREITWHIGPSDVAKNGLHQSMIEFMRSCSPVRRYIWMKLEFK